MAITAQSLSALRITSVSDVQQAQNGMGRHYFQVRMKQGLSKSVHRTFWSNTTDLSNGWERLSPEDAVRLLEQQADLSAFARITSSPIVPEEWVDDQGEVQTTTSRALVQFQDETLERALMAYGSRPSAEGLLGATRPEEHALGPAGGQGGQQQEGRVPAFPRNGLPEAL